MKTPRTEAVVRMAVGPMREYAIIEHAQNLERENIAMREALKKIERYDPIIPIMGSMGEYRQVPLDILKAVATIARLCLANTSVSDPCPPDAAQLQHKLSGG